MRPLTYRSKVWVYVTLFTASILALAFGILAVAYYFLSLNSFKKELVFVSKEIVKNHLAFENNQILFKKDAQDRTIGAFLRDENVSAIFYDAEMKSFASYGVYQRLLTEDTLDKHVNIDALKKSFDNNSPNFADVHFYQEEEYFTLDTPILFNNNKVGIVQVAIMTPFFTQVKSIGLYLLLSVICFSLMISWPLSSMLVGYILKPLSNLVLSMEQAKLNNLNFPIKYRGHPKDELWSLVSAYNKMLSRLAEGFDRQKDFISHASHELKAPLARVISSVDVILLDNESKEMRDVRDELFRFSSLIDELLVLSKVDSGMIKLQLIPISLKLLLDELIALYQKDIDFKHLTVSLHCAADILVNADMTCTRLILSNLISNAIKYSRSGGNIVIGCNVVDSEVTIDIIDSGIGMSREDLMRIFDRFFRSPEVSKTNGFGIGMSLVKQLCALHNLKINYVSALTKGTAVTISGFKKASHRE